MSLLVIEEMGRNIIKGRIYNIIWGFTSGVDLTMPFSPCRAKTHVWVCCANSGSCFADTSQPPSCTRPAQEQQSPKCSRGLFHVAVGGVVPPPPHSSCLNPQPDGHPRRGAVFRQVDPDPTLRGGRGASPTTPNVMRSDAAIVVPPRGCHQLRVFNSLFQCSLAAVMGT